MQLAVASRRDRAEVDSETWNAVEWNCGKSEVITQRCENEAAVTNQTCETEAAVTNQTCETEAAMTNQTWFTASSYGGSGYDSWGRKKARTDRKYWANLSLHYSRTRIEAVIIAREWLVWVWLRDKRTSFTKAKSWSEYRRVSFPKRGGKF